MRIGLVLNILEEDYQISLYRGIKKRASELGIQIMCFQEGNTQFLSNAFIGSFARKDYFALDGIILLTSVIVDSCTLNTRQDIQQIWGDVPVISVGQKIEGIPSLLIQTDNSMNELVEHLVNHHGYKNFLYISGSQTHQDAIIRQELFVRIIKKFQKKDKNIKYSITYGDFREQSAVTALSSFIDKNPGDIPDVIVCANDNMAIGVYKYLKLNEAACPKFADVAVTGFDDIPQGQFSIPSLTTVHQPLDTIGEQAVDFIFDHVKGKPVPMENFTGSHVVYRESCGCEKGELKPEEIKSSFDKLQSFYVSSEQLLKLASLMGRDLNQENDRKKLVSIINYNISILGIKHFCILKFPQKIDPGIQLSDNPLYVEPIYVRFDGKVIQKFPFKNKEEITLGQFYEFLNNLNDDNAPPLIFKNLNVGDDYIGCILYDAPEDILPYVILISVDIAIALKRIELNEMQQRYSEYLESEVARRMQELVKANNKRMQVEAEVLKISEIERQRFSNDLHDDICQRLAGISMLCRSYSKNSVKKEEMEELAELIGDTLQRTRQYAHDSYPVDLETLGLEYSLNNLCNSFEKQSGIVCKYEWTIPQDYVFDKIQKLNIFRIIQEALHNAMKHSEAKEVRVSCCTKNKNVVFSVSDNGKGMPVLDESCFGIGLNSMQYRANQMGADFNIDNGENGGVCVQIKL